MLLPLGDLESEMGEAAVLLELLLGGGDLADLLFCTVLLVADREPRCAVADGPQPSLAARHCQTTHAQGESK